MVPKIIHYCWFGNKEMPIEQQKFIEEWKKIMPDYVFKCWNENCIDINKISFAKQAYDAGKLAFVADYTRIYALYNEGGIYMDTDVKVKRKFDPFLDNGFFTSYEYHPTLKDLSDLKILLSENGTRTTDKLKVPGIGLLSAVIAAEKQHPFIKNCMDFYNSIDFYTVFSNKYTIPTVLAFHAEKYGFKYLDIEQKLEENIHIYPSNIFADYSKADKNSVAVHYCAGSWIEKNKWGFFKSRLNHIRFYRIVKEKVKSILTK